MGVLWLEDGKFQITVMVLSTLCLDGNPGKEDSGNSDKELPCISTICTLDKKVSKELVEMMLDNLKLPVTWMETELSLLRDTLEPTLYFMMVTCKEMLLEDVGKFLETVMVLLS